MNDTSSNVARHLRNAALNNPQAIATLSPLSVNEDGKVIHDWCSFLKLDQESDAAARIFHAEGVAPGTRTLLAVRAGHCVQQIYYLLRPALNQCRFNVNRMD